jgi:hypothetical protein|tara:strand:- start:642 stop:971 length:330 start_codon:yes stop_codon:yes gene_type:complete
MDRYEIDEPKSDVDYLKNLDMQDFLNCDETRKILQEENYQYFEENIKFALMRLFTRYAKNYNCDLFLCNDPDGEKNSDLFSEIVNNSLSDKNDLEVFYDNPHLAKKLLE